MIDQWVIQDAFAKINSLGSRAVPAEPMPSIFRYLDRDERFLEFVREQFRRYVMRPGTICFELTERRRSPISTRRRGSSAS